MWKCYCAPAQLEEALALLAQHGQAARVVAGGTDLLLEIERGIRKPGVLVDISRIPGLDGISLADGRVHLGPLVTHSQVVASRLLFDVAYPLARACLEVGSPQIRNRGTVAGNVITASPANDTVAPLRALDAQVTLRSMRGTRALALADFLQGVRRTALAPDELLVGVDFPALQPGDRGTFVKLGLRGSQAISVVNAAAVVAFDGPVVRQARLAFGSVAPTVVRAAEAERFLAGKQLTEDTIHEAAELAAGSVRPISDVRSPAGYRGDMVRVLAERALGRLAAANEREDWPHQPPLLATAQRPSTAGRDKKNGRAEKVQEGRCVPSASGAPGAAGREGMLSTVGTVHSARLGAPIELTVNGHPQAIYGAHDKTLLRLLRDDLDLCGTKEGCGEGECGACTVHMDGKAVMACLVPAPAAHGRQITTIEGLSSGDTLETLHPLQRAFIEADAIQCGYCSPGFIMAGAKLLEEYPHASREQIALAVSGNLCRCTGYVNILRAIELAASASGQPGDATEAQLPTTHAQLS